MRFDGARAAGLTDDDSELIRDGDESSTLSADQKLVLRLTDASLTDPAHVDAALTADLATRFTRAELVELTLALAMFLGMANVLISLGTEPEEMSTTILPTPAPSARA